MTKQLSEGEYRQHLRRTGRDSGCLPTNRARPPSLDTSDRISTPPRLTSFASTPAARVGRQRPGNPLPASDRLEAAVCKATRGAALTNSTMSAAIVSTDLELVITHALPDPLRSHRSPVRSGLKSVRRPSLCAPSSRVIQRRSRRSARAHRPPPWAHVHACHVADDLGGWRLPEAKVRTRRCERGT
jgi:hypothetical protein